MLSFVSGKLYKCRPDLYFLAYPTKEKATVATAGGAPTATRSVYIASRVANHWSNKLNCVVRYTKPDDIVLFLKEEAIKPDNELYLWTKEGTLVGGCFYQFLVSDFTGWIICSDWVSFK